MVLLIVVEFPGGPCDEGGGVRVTVAACNGLVVLRATTLALVLPVRVGLDLVTTVAVEAVEGLRDVDDVVDVVTGEAVVNVEGGGEGDDVADVEVVEGTEQKKTCAKWKTKNKNNMQKQNICDLFAFKAAFWRHI